VEAVFLALSHEARRHVLLLLSHLGGELPSGYLAARFQHSWPTTSRHLKVLEEAGLVEVRREGRGSLYRLNRERLRRVVEGWLRHLEPIGPEQKWSSSGPKTTSELADDTKSNARNARKGRRR
jgi:DNA-binding transcriptional ArsR family regulator